jgi:hypothetical protein
VVFMLIFHGGVWVWELTQHILNSFYYTGAIDIKQIR